jgi:glycosyltransferase involved in cell wall biosynthesis
VALLDRSVPTFLLGSGPLEPDLRLRAQRLGIADVVLLAGWQRRIGPWLRGASACVVPSRHEAWSQTAVTAMANRVPVVGTAVEGLPLTLGERRGVVVASGDPVALAEGIEQVVSGKHLPDLAAAERYAAGFTLGRVATRYAGVYRLLLARYGRSPATRRAVG